MKKILLLMTLVLSLFLTACGNYATNVTYEENNYVDENESQKTEPLRFVYAKSVKYNGYTTVIQIYVDTKTQVMYMDNGKDMIELKNPDGTLRLYEGEFD